MPRTVKRYVNVGDVVTVQLPCSEVCMFMKVADTIRRIQIGPCMAQILDKDGKPFSFPITFSEAGVYSESGETDDLHYVYEVTDAA